MDFSKNTKVTASVLVLGLALAFPCAANAESLSDMVSSPQMPEQKKYVIQTTEFGEFSSFQEMVAAIAVKRSANLTHIEVLKTLYKDYIDEEDTVKLDSIQEESAHAATYDELVEIAQEIDEEKIYLEEKKQKAIAEAEAKRKAAEEAVAREAQAQNYSSNSSSYSSSGQYSSDTGDARSFIIQKESGGNYTAENGRYYGAYQLDRSYLNGDYSAENQDRTAENYVANRYGSWEAAKAFWEQHGWY